jgi:2-hydroxychromene-2-carboxylate isomerase
MTNALFYFDFASPNAYLSHRVIPDIKARTGVRFTYVPVLLGGLFKLTNNRSPMEAFGDVKNKLAYENLETQRFIKRHGLTAFRMNPHFPLNTLRLMRGAVAAQGLGLLEAYVEMGMTAMWEAGLKMDDPDVMAKAIADAGLDAAALMAAIEDPAVKQGLLDNTNAAVEAGAFGIPSFVVDGELWFGKDRLRDVEEAMGGSHLRP